MVVSQGRSWKGAAATQGRLSWVESYLHGSGPLFSCYSWKESKTVRGWTEGDEKWPMLKSEIIKQIDSFTKEASLQKSLSSWMKISEVVGDSV